MPLSTQNLSQSDIDYLRSLPSSEFEAWLSKIAQEDEDLAAQILFRVGSRQIATKRDIADFFGVALETIDLWARKGMPIDHKVGGESRFDPSHCARWLAKQKASGVGTAEKQSDNEYREEKRKIATLQRRKMEGELYELRHLEDRLAQVKGTIRIGLDTMQKAFGDDVISELSTIIDDVINAIFNDRPPQS